MTDAIADWTTGTPALVYQTCPACTARWYFRRDFCPRCGAAPRTEVASGRGTVHALSLVTRAPTPEMRPYAPYLIMLVDAEEGFRLMAHGDPGLAIGDRVRLRFETRAGRLLPYFEPAAGGTG